MKIKLIVTALVLASTFVLVMCLTNGWCYAARDFGLPLGASDEHTLHGSVRSEQRRGRPKELRPEGLRRKWPGASLLLSHVSLRICSFVAPRPRPFWAQHNTSHLLDTSLVAQRNAQTGHSGLAGPNEAVLSKLSEIVAIRERLAKNYELMLGAGRAQADGLAEIDLAEARIELARERGQSDGIITELEGLVAAHERRVKRIRDGTLDRIPLADVDKARAELLEAEVRLLRAQK